MQSYEQHTNYHKPMAAQPAEYDQPMSRLPETRCAKQPAVATALDRLTENVTSISKITELLEQRLQPVLRNEPESPLKDEMCDGLVPLSQAITGSVNNLARAKDRLSSILNRLEL